MIEEKGKKEFEESFEETKESTPNNRVLKKTRSQENLRIESDEHRNFQKNTTKENHSKNVQVIFRVYFENFHRKTPKILIISK